MFASKTSIFWVLAAVAENFLIPTPVNTPEPPVAFTSTEAESPKHFAAVTVAVATTLDGAALIWASPVPTHPASFLTSKVLIPANAAIFLTPIPVNPVPPVALTSTEAESPKHFASWRTVTVTTGAIPVPVTALIWAEVDTLHLLASKTSYVLDVLTASSLNIPIPVKTPNPPVAFTSTFTFSPTHLASVTVALAVIFELNKK